MKSKLNPLSVGSFVIGGVILIITGLLSFQSLNFFQKPIRFISYFDESVQGLDVGSNVKLRGVAIGRVVAIKIQYDWNVSQSRVAVLCEINRSAITDRAGNTIKISDPIILKRLIQEGLRAKIDLVGITGMQFVQLTFADPVKYPETYVVTDTTYPVIPTIDSGMSKLTDNLVAIAENFRKVDLQGISTELKSLLTALNKKTNDLDLKRMSSQITAAAQAIKRLADFIEKNPSSLIFGRRK